MDVVNFAYLHLHRQEDFSTHHQVRGILPDGYEKTKEYFKEWYKSLGSVRRLAKLHVNKLPKISRPLALVGYLKSTYEQFSTFGALYTHALYRRMAETERDICVSSPQRPRLVIILGCLKGGEFRWLSILGKMASGSLLGKAMSMELCGERRLMRRLAKTCS